MQTETSQTGKVMAAIRARIEARALTTGDRLPSIRRFASSMGVSPSTVVEAYDRLAAEGLIRSRAGSGFYVSATALPPLKLAATETPQARAVDPFWVSRQSLDAEEDALMPGCGWLPPAWMPEAALRKSLRNLSRASTTLLTDYGSSHGSIALRRLLIRRGAEDGLQIEPEQLMLTASGSQALDLLCRFLLRPGDTVLVDDPCYFNFQALLRAHQVKIESVPYTLDGPDMAAFEAALNLHNPRLYLTNSALQNPTGASISPQKAHRLLNLASAHDLIIVEDEIFADFEPEPSTRLAALDGLRHVIRIGSFSKTLSASIRCGYIAARRDWIDGLVDLQVASNFGGPSPMATEIIADVLTGGSYRKHMEEVRRRLARARREAAERLARLGIEPWNVPRGGFYLWCRLAEGMDASTVAQKALKEGVLLAPGNIFSHARTAENFMRFNVAQMAEPKIWEVLERVAEG